MLGLGTPEEKELNAIRNETKALNRHKESIVRDINELSSVKENIQVQIEAKKASLIEFDEKVLLQEFGLYKPMYEFVNSEQYKAALDQIRESQKDLIKSGLAATGFTNWQVNGSTSKGQKLVADTQKLLLRAFNSECEHVTGKVKYSNFDSCEKRITTACSTISRLGKVMGISITNEYLDLKIQELHLAYEYQQMKQDEKERQRELREQQREEAKLQREIEEERKKIKKEQKHYANALKAAKKQLSNTTDEFERASLEDKISEYESQLNDIDKNLADVDYRESNQRAGYVYVISNIGSFGEGVYKIGMTRRLDPMERIHELGDASVPFNFDVHAMIFTDDAPGLENTLHKAFENKKVNMINTRREFFKVSLDEIEQTIKENFDGSVEFVKEADAEQYRESEKMRESLMMNCIQN